MAKLEKHGPQRGSPRVQAWIFGAINPLVRALGVEAQLLKERNLTWRFYNKELEFIRPPIHHLDPDGQLVFDDFIRSLAGREPVIEEHGDLVVKLDEHRETIEALCEGATSYYQSLVTQERFAPLVEEALREYLEYGKSTAPGRYVASVNRAVAGMDPQLRRFDPEPWGAFGQSALKDLVAEHLVNGVEALPDRRTDAAFWDFFRQRAYHAKVLDLAAPRALRTVLETRIKKAEQEAVGLVDDLATARHVLCDRFDVPSAPIAGVFCDNLQ